MSEDLNRINIALVEISENKLKADGNEVVSETNQLRLTAPDGKRRWSGVSLTARKSRDC